MQLTMGKALALIFTGCGIMLLCNFCIFFLVDNVRKNRNRNRGSIIRKRSTRRKSVSFTNPLVKQTVGQSNPSPGEEIEMVDLGSSRAQSNPPPLLLLLCRHQDQRAPYHLNQCVQLQSSTWQNLLNRLF